MSAMRRLISWPSTTGASTRGSPPNARLHRRQRLAALPGSALPPVAAYRCRGGASVSSSQVEADEAQRCAVGRHPECPAADQRPGARLLVSWRRMFSRCRRRPGALAATPGGPRQRRAKHATPMAGSRTRRNLRTRWLPRLARLAVRMPPRAALRPWRHPASRSAPPQSPPTPACELPGPRRLGARGRPPPCASRCRSSGFPDRSWPSSRTGPSGSGKEGASITGKLEGIPS